MAEILIKNMEMPKYCRSCRFEESSIYGQQCCITRKFTRLDNNEDGMERHISCPLVEVPTHGDLIDRQKLLEHRFEVYDSNEEVCEDYIETYHVIEAPAIIEASTEGEASR